MTDGAPDKLTYADVVWERAPCPLCGATEPSDPVLVGRDFVWRKEGDFPIVRCGGCALLYQHPRPSPGTMRYYYEDCYSGESEAKMRTFQLESRLYRIVSGYRAVTIDKVRKITAGQRVLDIGASYGAFVEWVRVERGAEMCAIDLDPGSIEKFVNTTDIDVRCGDLLEAGYPNDHFDVVTLFETLEHVYEPVRTLQEARRILKPGGLVSVEVPNWDGWLRPLFGKSWIPLLLPTHLQHFSRATLRRCVETAGLEVAHHQTMLYPAELTFSVIISILRVIGNPPDDEKGPLRKVVDVFIGLWAVFLLIFVDLPIMFWLRIFGRAGHQTLVARKPLT